MTAIDKKVMAAKLLQTLELMEFGNQLMRQNITRKLPGASEETIDKHMKR